MALAGEAEAGHAGEQPARNSQLETHPDDEPGHDPAGSCLRRMDRFPHAFVNSCSFPQVTDHGCGGGINATAGNERSNWAGGR